VPDLGRKYTCYSCHTKFYDLGKAVPICPKCGADQRDAEEAPVTTSSRGRGASRAAPPPVVVEEPIEEDFAAEGETPVAESEDEEELIAEPEREEEEAEDEDEGEEY
jgi:uncharacterized protein (TIGR02300 family)